MLFGLFDWSIDGFDQDRIILVNVGRGRRFRGLDGFVYNGTLLVSVGGGRGIRVVHNFFNDSELGIFVLFLTTMSLYSAVHGNGQDKEHPEDNSNTAA